MGLPFMRNAGNRFTIANLNHNLSMFSRDLAIAQFESHAFESPESRSRIANSVPLRQKLSEELQKHFQPDLPSGPDPLRTPPPPQKT